MRLAICVVALAACGGPDRAAAPTAPRPAPEPTPVAAEPPEPEPPPVASDDERLGELYRCWFERPYPYMFKSADPRSSTFTAGPRGIVWYGNLAGCMARISGGTPSRVVGDVKPIEMFSGLEVFVDSAGPFREYNPELIRWGHENLIPPPDTMLGDLSARDRYHAQFSRFFRLMTESYLTLHSSMKITDEVAAYRGAIDGGTDGLRYLEKRYAGDLADLAIPADMTALTVPMAFGFWLRRSIDNTADELWIGLRKVMRLYDPEWYARVQKRYSKAAVNW